MEAANGCLSTPAYSNTQHKTFVHAMHRPYFTSPPWLAVDPTNKRVFKANGSGAKDVGPELGVVYFAGQRPRRGGGWAMAALGLM